MLIRIGQPDFFNLWSFMVKEDTGTMLVSTKFFCLKTPIKLACNLSSKVINKQIICQFTFLEPFTVRVRVKFLLALVLVLSTVCFYIVFVHMFHPIVVLLTLWNQRGGCLFRQNENVCNLK